MNQISRQRKISYVSVQVALFTYTFNKNSPEVQLLDGVYRASLRIKTGIRSY